VILSGNTLYGTTGYGGSGGVGTVFAINSDGRGFTTLYSFTNGSDGGVPYAGLILSGNTLYGTAGYSANSVNSTVFAINTDGSGFATLYNFTGGSDGADPTGGVILSGNTLYGTAGTGGSSGKGTVFAVNTDGTGFTTLYSFTGSSDGAYPRARLILSGNTLYGTALSGGSSYRGTVFAINTDGTGFTNLHSFNDSNDGGGPPAGLVLSGNTLYGTAASGGGAGGGTVFALTTDGTHFEVLHSFSSALIGGTNSDGTILHAGLLLSGNILYGTAIYGGGGGNGTVFAVNTDGTGFTNLYSFTAGSGSYPYITNSDGAIPEDYAGLILSGNTLYGTAQYGGSAGSGTVFSLSLPVPPPQLTIVPDGGGGYFLRLTNAVPGLGYRLQRAHSLPGPWTTSAPQTAPASGLVEFHDLFPPPDRSFYRAAQM
jgi:uncharacterized repeat protein (TIGR03803 family)